MAAVTLTVVKEALLPAHGESIVRPTLEPRRRRMIVVAAAATEPPITGPQAKAGVLDLTSTGR